MDSRRRCTIFNNKNPSEGTVILIPQRTTFQNFLQLATQKLNLPTPATKIYTDSGAAVEDIALIRDNDTLFVSCGESFNTKAPGSKLSSVNISNMNNTFQIAVMGPGAVGKSALTLQYVQGIFVVDYDPTIEDAYRKNINLPEDNTPCTLDILDTAGQEDYVALRTCWYRNKDGFLLVFSTVDRSSFDTLHKFYDELININDAVMPPVIIVGNKADLVDQRVVSSEEALAFVSQFEKLYPIWYIETSAKTGQNVDKAFNMLARKIRDRNRNLMAKRESENSSGLCNGKFCTIL